MVDSQKQAFHGSCSTITTIHTWQKTHETKLPESELFRSSKIQITLTDTKL